MSEEQEPFLALKERINDADRVNVPSRNGKHQLPKKDWRFRVMMHGLLILIYTIVSFAVIHAYTKVTIFHPSAVEGLNFQYQSTVFHNLSRTPYAGPPSPELDAAWDKLLASMHIRVSRAELQQDNQESVALPEGGGFLGWMGVFHELHCIKMLRQWNYRDYYHPDIDAAEREHLGSHIDHCFEMLRQAAVCKADSSLTTFKWHPTKARPMFNASESIHQCVDWDILMDSVEDRVVQEEEILRLDNPLMKLHR